jgi:Uma2 family endonuclease
MDAPVRPTPPRPTPGEPAWEVARLFPDQGTWSEQEYLDLNSNQLVEFSGGLIEVLPMPTTSHQRIVGYLYRTILASLLPGKLGSVLFAPLKVRLWPGKFREPDLVFLLAGHADRIGEDFWEGADLVIEVVSDENRRHDLETKRREYAQAGIPEYWIVDPRDGRSTVLRLDGPAYAEHGAFGRGQSATSALLEGFAVPVADVLDAPD